MNIEKPMLSLLGVPMVGRIIESIDRSSSFDHVVVATSPKTPNTRDFVRELGVHAIETSGRDYFDDLRSVARLVDCEWLVAFPSDTPLITPELVRDFLHAIPSDEVCTFSMVTSAEKLEEMNLTYEYVTSLKGSRYAFVGINAYHIESIFRESSEQRYHIEERAHLLVNVNTLRDYVVAMRLALSSIKLDVTYGEMDLVPLSTLKLKMLYGSRVADIAREIADRGIIRSPIIVEEDGVVIEGEELAIALMELGILSAPAVFVRRSAESPSKVVGLLPSLNVPLSELRIVSEYLAREGATPLSFSLKR